MMKIPFKLEGAPQIQSPPLWARPNEGGPHFAVQLQPATLFRSSSSEKSSGSASDFFCNHHAKVGLYFCVRYAQGS
jgi:hypothetical protein